MLVHCRDSEGAGISGRLGHLPCIAGENLAPRNPAEKRFVRNDTGTVTHLYFRKGFWKAWPSHLMRMAICWRIISHEQVLDWVLGQAPSALIDSLSGHYSGWPDSVSLRISIAPRSQRRRAL